MKKTKTRIQRTLSTLLAACLILANTSCGNQKKADPGVSPDTDDIQPTDPKTEVLEEISEYPLPTAFDVTKLLVEAGASYILNLCNPVGNVNRYLSLKSKALNLGIYGADLSYAATYNQAQETMQYLDVSRELIDDLEIEAGFNQELVERIERNIDNVDSLIVYITDSFYRTYEYLTSNEQDDMSILVMAGSWVEALYITTQISMISQDNSEIIEIISQQNASLETLLEVMHPISVIDTGADIYEALTSLQEIYQEAGEEFTEEELDRLSAKTEEIRMMIIS
jgi:hypothetical protein